MMKKQEMTTQECITPTIQVKRDDRASTIPPMQKKDTESNKKKSDK